MSNISSTSKLPCFHRPSSSWESQVLYKHKYIWVEEAWPMGMFWFFPEITHWSLLKESGRVPKFPDLQCFVLADRQYLLQAACALAAFTDNLHVHSRGHEHGIKSLINTYFLTCGECNQWSLVSYGFEFHGRTLWCPVKSTFQLKLFPQLGHCRASCVLQFSGV